MDKLCVCTISTLSADTKEKHAAFCEELVDCGFHIIYLVDRVSEDTTASLAAWIVQQGFAPCGFGYQWGVWIIARQPSLIALPSGQWQTSVVENVSQVLSPELFLVISEPENHAAIKCAVLHRGCTFLLASDLGDGVVMARVECA